MLRLPAPVVRATLPLVRELSVAPRLPRPVRRAALDLVAGSMPRPGGTRASWGRIGGVPALRVDPPGDPKPREQGAVLYFHGGGYVVGSPSSHRPGFVRLAVGTGLPVLGLDYRLAPEHPFPAAFDDGVAAYRALRTGGTPAERIILGGDSAGAGMALALAMRLRDEGERPRCAALICPWVDLTAGASWRSGDDPDPLLSRAAVLGFARDYVGGASDDWRASPLHGDLAGLPPLVVHTAGDDILRPDGLELVERARAAGVTVDHRDYPGLWHDFHALAGLLGAGDDALVDLVEAILRT
ncbi:alpha/beta hydrolase [Sporichthya brevicatena]|uniref:Alpha/beta hydrolase n=1 Tax=Sporichthya brevicatena TaxID=171442 RepID=A0ABN1HAR3_9ACTN